jgi:NADH:ubiquinone oxidoreductase subunit 5 (subunit L)/multisubunit Na+/H+ antiporter MnhA subunit
VHCLVFFGAPAVRAEAEARPGQDPAGWIQYGLTLLAIMTISVGMLSPAQFWGDLLGIAPMDTIGSFLSTTLAGPADPPIEGGLRWQLVAGCVVGTLAGIALALRRHLRDGLRAEPERPALALGLRTLRETFFLEQGIDRLVVRPLRGFSRSLLANVVEARLLDRAVVAGSAGIVRRAVWSGLRRLQNGRIQSYAMLGMIALLLSVLWLAD